MAKIETVNRNTIELWEVWATNALEEAWIFLGRFDTAKEANIEALNHSLRTEFGPKREYIILPVQIPVDHPNPYHRSYHEQVDDDELPF